MNDSVGRSVAKSSPSLEAIAPTDEPPASWWTGKPPERGSCPGVDADGILRSLPPPDLSTLTRQGLLDYWDNAWTLTEVLFSALQGKAAFYEPPRHGLRHPLIFYYCHPAVLYVNTLRRAGFVEPATEAGFERRFVLGVDEMAWDRLSPSENWPRVDEVTAYRSRTYHLLRRLLEEHPELDRPWLGGGLGAADDVRVRAGLRWAMLLGIEHERIHLETSSVLMRELPPSCVRRPAAWPDAYPRADGVSISPRPRIDYPEHVLLGVPAGEVCVGKPVHLPSYGWDNEYGARRLRVPAFRVGQALISNGQFREFVASGGYREPRHWSAEGWQWRARTGARRPAFWVERGAESEPAYDLRLCFDVVAMQWSWPALVTFHEARAYAAWQSERDGVPYRLITEAEHHRLRSVSDQACSDANWHLRWGSERPVQGGALGPNGIADVFGNVWQWCEDHFAALPGFSPEPLYDDFSTPCFDGKHNLIMGGSFASTGGLTSPWARFHFRRHFMQHVGFRLVQPESSADAPPKTCVDSPPPHVGPGPCCSSLLHAGYESERSLRQYLALHYAAREESSPTHPLLVEPLLDFPDRCARLLIQACRAEGLMPLRALDLGCAVGGASFALAREFAEVVGIDLSERFLAAAEALKSQGELGYSRTEEGDRVSPQLARVDPTLRRARVQFRRADACSLPEDLGTFDAILLANLLCRLPRPRACLAKLAGLLRAGGLLLITSPYSWLAEYTPREEWIGGGAGEGGSRESLLALLSHDFELLRETDEPLLIREHARKFQFIIAHATLWRRRA
jgi:5-histidylcysteine sulfoxide synthase/putative 4-mercaptohistidine N1-methyltranferase